MKYDWILNSKRPVCVPEGLHGAEEILKPMCEMMGIRLVYYPLHIVTSRDEKNNQQIENILNQKPVLLILPTSVRIDSPLLQQMSGRVSIFSSVSTGTDHVNLDLLQERKIPFLHAPGVNARSVVEYVLSALPYFIDEKRLEKNSLKVGIVGFGNVGRRLGLFLEHLGIPYIFSDPLIGDRRAVSLERALSCDVVSFQVPLTYTGEHPTFHMIKKNTWTYFKDNSLIINTSRGKIFTEKSYDHICRTHPTIMDVFYNEPPVKEVLELSDMVSPHIAGYNYEARVGGTKVLADQFARLVGYTGTMPELPEVEKDHYVLDFLPEESRRLKENPESFTPRRGKYPPRGSLADYAKDHSIESLHPFHKRLIQANGEINW